MSDMRELNDAELDAVSGAFAIVIDLGFVKATASVNNGGMSGSIKIGDGKTHGGTIFFD